VASAGRFITLEGGEGVGKSTLAAGLKEHLEHLGWKVVLTREPGGTPGAEAIRRLLLNPPDGVRWTSMSEILLFYAARHDHLQKLILPTLATGSIVICDRFSDSTRAYQSASGAPTEQIETVEKLSVGPNAPDLTLILDMPRDAANIRLQKRGSDRDAIELRDAAYHERVRDAFLAIASSYPDRCVVIDAGAPPEVVLASALETIVARLPEIQR
jgi:dTMP kinase